MTNDLEEEERQLRVTDEKHHAVTDQLVSKVDLTTVKQLGFLSVDMLFATLFDEFRSEEEERVSRVTAEKLHAVADEILSKANLKATKQLGM